MVVSDLDGTLLRRDQTVSPADLETLNALGSEAAIRVIATGRSLFSARKVLAESFPIDYLVFSSGAGVLDWRRKSLVRKHNLAGREVRRAVAELKAQSADFMVHRPVPDNHFFVYFHSGRKNDDFTRRCELYRDFSVPRDYSEPFSEEACQVLAVEPPGNRMRPDAAALCDVLAERLHPLTVIRTTSPLDGVSTWIEIFPSGVSKACAAEWIAAKEGIDRDGVLALGNDYNDMDLLDWAKTCFIVANAPEDLKARFRTVGSHEESGFTEAVRKWMGG